MKTLVIGGGMSGLTYGIVASVNGQQVTVAERNLRVGKKIAMTGNGKCNVGNKNVNLLCYNKSQLVKSVLQDVSVEEYLTFLRSCGIFTFADEQGRLYPLSESASNVVDCLRFRLGNLGAKVACNATVTSVQPCLSGGYNVTLDGAKQHFDRVVLACGSGSQTEVTNAQVLVGQDKFTALYPSLTPVRVSNMDAVLNGIRAKANVTLLCDGNAIAKQSGEILFKDYGLSGICIFNLSAIIARRMVEGKQGAYVFEVDLVPTMQQSTLAETLFVRLRKWEKDKLFYGILHNKVGECIVKRCGNNLDANNLAYVAKNLSFTFDRLLDWSMSQVTAGGIDEKFVDSKTLALPNGVVCLGEVLNVDGVCGGYNLFFAGASALHVFDKQQRKKCYDSLI